MDNIKINNSERKIEIKKGIIKRKYFITFNFINFFLFLLISIPDVEKLPKIIYFICILIWIELVIYTIFIFIALSSMGFYLNFYLEKINIDIYSQTLSLEAPKLSITFPLQELDEIKVCIPKNISYFRGKFQEWCTLTFITKKGKKYLWGFRLSEKKGNELKKEIEKLIIKNKDEEKKQ